MISSLESKKLDLEFEVDSYKKRVRKTNFTSNVTRHSPIKKQKLITLFSPKLIRENLHPYLLNYPNARTIYLNIIPPNECRTKLGEYNSVKITITYDRENHEVKITSDNNDRFNIRFTLQVMYVNVKELTKGHILNTIESYLNVLQKIMNKRHSTVNKCEQLIPVSIQICDNKMAIEEDDGSLHEYNRIKHTKIDIDDCEDFMYKMLEREIDASIGKTPRVERQNDVQKKSTISESQIDTVCLDTSDNETLVDHPINESEYDVMSETNVYDERLISGIKIDDNVDANSKLGIPIMVCYDNLPKNTSTIIVPYNKLVILDERHKSENHEFMMNWMFDELTQLNDKHSGKHAMYFVFGTSIFTRDKKLVRKFRLASINDIRLNSTEEEE